MARLDLGLVTRLRDAVPVPLVLHGSSGVPDDTLRAGELRADAPKGTPPEEVAEVILGLVRSGEEQAVLPAPSR